MKCRRIIKIHTRQPVYFNPMDEFTAGFVGTTNWLEGEIERASGGRTLVRTNADAIVECTGGEGHRPGSKVRLAVRPEAIDMSGEVAAPQPGTNEIGGRGVCRGCNANLTRYQVQAGSVTFQVYGPPQSSFAPNDRVALRFAATSAVLFPRPGA